jgi:tetratricopeptide (TPR) repeat protein
MIKKGFFALLMVISFIGIAQEKDAITLKNEGNEAYKNKDFSTAYTAYSAALTLLEKDGIVDTTYIYNAGYCAFKADKLEQAIPYLEKTIELNYKEEKPYVSLGQVYMKQDNLPKMEQVLNQGLTKYPEDKTLKKLMSHCYLKQGLEFYKIGNDIKSKANSSGLNTSDPEAFKAEYTKADEEFKKALPLMEKSVSFDEKNDKALKALQNIYVNLEMAEKADEIKVKLESL